MNTENYKTDEQVWYEIIDAATPEDIIPSASNPYIYQYVDLASVWAERIRRMRSISRWSDEYA